jgi:hypothetical protein
MFGQVVVNALRVTGFVKDEQNQIINDAPISLGHEHLCKLAWGCLAHQAFEK